MALCFVPLRDNPQDDQVCVTAWNLRKITAFVFSPWDPKLQVASEQRADHGRLWPGFSLK